jgi:hypothetical protein
MRLIFLCFLLVSVSSFSTNGPISSMRKVINGVQYSVITDEPFKKNYTSTYFRDGEMRKPEYNYFIDQIGREALQKFPLDPAIDPYTDCRGDLGCLTVDYKTCEEIDATHGYRSGKLTKDEQQKCLDFEKGVEKIITNNRMKVLNKSETEKINKFAKSENLGGIVKSYVPFVDNFSASNAKTDSANFTPMERALALCGELRGRATLSSAIQKGMEKKLIDYLGKAMTVENRNAHDPATR